MTISIECVQCEADFEYEVAELLRDPSLLVCPNCGAKANSEVVEMAMNAADELVTQLRRLKRKFRFSITLETDEMAATDGDENMYADEEDSRESLWSDEPEEEEDDE